jgi:hypothetical protein
MKLSDYEKVYHEFSGKTSDITRKLAFAGIALVWIFKIETLPTPMIPKELRIPTILLALTLIFDLLQYVAGTTIWGIFQWHQERKLENLKDDPELEAPSWFKRPQLFFFCLKVITVLSAYFFITVYVWGTCLKAK